MYRAKNQCLVDNMGHKQRQMTVDFPFPEQLSGNTTGDEIGLLDILTPGLNENLNQLACLNTVNVNARGRVASAA